MQMAEPTFLRCPHLLDSKGHSSSFSLSSPPFQRLEFHIWLPNDPPPPPAPGGKAKPGDPVVGKGAGRLGVGWAEGPLAFFPRLQWAQRPSLGRRGALCSPPASPGRQYASH